MPKEKSTKHVMRCREMSTIIIIGSKERNENEGT